MRTATTSSEKLSVGYFCPGWPLSSFPSGIVTYVSILSHHLKLLGHRVSILADPVAEGTHEPEVYNLRAYERLAPRDPWGRLSRKLWQKVSPTTAHQHFYQRALVKTISQAVAELGIQVLEVEESYGWAGQLQEALSIPVCVRLHGPWFQVGPQIGHPRDARFRARVGEEGKAILEVAGVTAPSRFVLDRTREHYGAEPARAMVIPNPVEPTSEPWELDQADPLRVAFIGRFDRLKGGDLIIDAFKHVSSQIPEAKLWFIGPDPGCRTPDGRRWNLEQYVEHRLPGAMGLGRVEWLGRQPRPALARYRRQALVCVVCSLYETFPYTMVEAMSLGCPVIGARVGGIPELLKDQRNGLLHEPGDAEDLARKIVWMIRNPDQAASLGRQAAIDSRESLDPIHIAEETIAFYRSMLSGHGA